MTSSQSLYTSKHTESAYNNRDNQTCATELFTVSRTYIHQIGYIIHKNLISMDMSGITLCVFVAATALSAATAQSCQACNCQLNNAQVLDQLVETKVKHILVNGSSKSLPKHPKYYFLIYITANSRQSSVRTACAGQGEKCSFQ